MKQSTLKLLVPASAVYILFLFFLRSFIPENVTPTVALLAIPLVILAAIFVGDLSSRAVRPSRDLVRVAPRKMIARHLSALTKQVDVAARASPGYFDSVVRGHLRDLLVDKVSLETGVEKESVRTILADKSRGPQLLRDTELYQLLYYPPPRRAQERLPMVKEIVNRIEGWKP